MSSQTNPPRPTLARLAPQGNNLSESGIIEIAKAIHGHKYLCELSLANQRSTISTAALQAMLTAMETVKPPPPLPGDSRDSPDGALARNRFPPLRKR